ncbi:Radical SAM domain protein [Thermoproteus uzoniensis 768-20]|uniref:Radical SAM domain protein n=1 Tax=Thermoproteus uzoniensis (strain 768-20) TaxID=999630 RepID=F2L252_THEU7|nr:radical SAM protein [Thermoproteus uzoniensis]AEA12979.1 Radical SAM domain protein [Thermoproteus uzoniensis 768-20]
MLTRIYHVTYYLDIRSAYFQFAGCNFSCPWCIRRLTPWDHHLDSRTLASLRAGGFLSLRAFQEVADKLVSDGMEEAVLGGEEPTVDDALPAVIRHLAGRARVRLLTNAYRLTAELLDELRRCATCEVVVSIKTLDAEKHREYTGKPLEPVLRNISALVEAGVRTLFETVLIPGLNGPEGVERIAKYLRENVGDAVLIIDPLIPVPGTGWRRPTEEELRDAVERAQRYVAVRMHGEGRRSRSVVVYPSQLLHKA